MRIESVVPIVPPNIIITMEYKEARELFARMEEPDLKEIFRNHEWSKLGELKEELRKVLEK